MSLLNFLKKIRKRREGPSGTSWKDILNEIYVFAPHIYGESSKMSFHDDEHPLAKKLKIRGYELMLGISFLETNGLIKKVVQKSDKEVSYRAILKLTEKGFNVAMKNESFRINMIFQEIMTLSISLTALIAGITFLLDQVISSSFEGWLVIVLLINILIIFVIAFVIGPLLLRLIAVLWPLLFRNKK